MPHTHYWKLDAPKDGVVHGLCKSCGLEREFPQDQLPARRRQKMYTTLPKNPGPRAEAAAPPAAEMTTALEALVHLLPPPGTRIQRDKWVTAFEAVLRLCYPD